MEALIVEQEKLANGGNLEKSLEDVQKTIDILVNAREAIATSTSINYSRTLTNCGSPSILTRRNFLDPNSAGLTLAKIQNPTREAFEVINSDLKEVYKKLNNYDKALTKVSRAGPRVFFLVQMADRDDRNSKISLCLVRIMMPCRISQLSSTEQ